MSQQLIESLLIRNKEAPEVRLLFSIAHEIYNFRKGFKGHLRHTYITSYGFSSSLAFDIEGKNMLMGVPEGLYEVFFLVKWHGLVTIPGKQGVYLVYQTSGEQGRPAAIKIQTTLSRSELIGRFKEITVCKMDKRAESNLTLPGNTFTLTVKTVPNLEWEYI